MSFESRVKKTLEGLQFPSVGTMEGCPSCDGDGYIEFTSRECETCGALPGSRYAVHMLDPEHGPIHMDVCCECLEYIANGTVPEEPDIQNQPHSH